MSKRFPRKLTIPRIKEARLSNSWSQLETRNVILQAAGAERTITFSGLNGITVSGLEGNPDIVYIDGSDVSSGVTDHGLLSGLSDDDHTQYHTDGRADTWFATKSHSNLLDIGTNAHDEIDIQIASFVTHSGDSTIHFTEASVDHGSIAGLGDDDHSQYHTDARALTWLGTRSTSDLSEGTNLYYTEARVSANTDVTANTAARHDAVTVTDTATVNLTLTGQDIKADVIASAVDHGSLSGLSDDDHSQYHNDARGDARYYTETELDAGQLDNRYYTETESDAVHTGLSAHIT